jgi:hypothetical protein
MILKEDYKILNIKILKGLCKRIAGIHGYSQMTKTKLVQEYNKFLATRLIIYNFRKHFYKNATDSITLEPVTFPCFIYRVKTGKVFFYEYESIIKYIMKSGKVVDPNTRNVYTDSELSRLDSQAKFYFPYKNYKSTLKIKKNENYAKRIKNRENEILAFQMRLDEIKIIVLTIITDDILSWGLNESFIVDNLEYSSLNDYITSIIHELKILFINLKSYCVFEANCFKTDFINKITETGRESDFFLKILQKM